jgi:hypothetical protein
MLTPAKCVELARSYLTEEHWKRIVDTAIHAAMEGDKNSRDFLAKLVLPEKIDESGDIGDERARVVIFKEATAEDFKRVQVEREAKEAALKEMPK